MLVFHIAAGLLSLIAGAVALFAAKGGTLHRRSGTTFAVAMLLMSSTGTLLGVIKGEPLSVAAGVLTFYLVSSGWLVLQRTLEQSRGLTTLLMLLATGLALVAFAGAALLSGKSSNSNVVGLYIFGSVALLAALADLRLLRRGAIQGGQRLARRGAIQGGQRLARHLGRMGFALFIANVSFFLGQAKVLPVAWRQSGLLGVPVLVVALVTLYWLLRVRRGRRPVARTAAAP